MTVNRKVKKVLFRRYLKRFDDELEQINLKQSISKNRSNQHASRLNIIKMTLEREVSEYNGGGIGEFVLFLRLNILPDSQFK